MDLQDLDTMGDYTLFGGGADGTDFSSPVIGQSLDFSSSYNSSVADLATVSPQDLTLPLSTPNSTTFTNLTSPSLYHQSPAFGSFEPSPASDFVDVDGSWKPLFPQVEQQLAQSLSQSPVVKPLSETDFLASRRKSSTASPKGSSPRGRHSSVNGVSSRKRDKPLPPIVVEDPEDTTAVKRARNTLAARKSRERKANFIDRLQEDVNARDETIASQQALLAAKDEEIARLQAELEQWKGLMGVSQ